MLRYDDLLSTHILEGSLEYALRAFFLKKIAFS